MRPRSKGKSEGKIFCFDCFVLVNISCSGMCLYVLSACMCVPVCVCVLVEGVPRAKQNEQTDRICSVSITPRPASVTQLPSLSRGAIASGENQTTARIEDVCVRVCAGQTRRDRRNQTDPIPILAESEKMMRIQMKMTVILVEMF